MQPGTSEYHLTRVDGQHPDVFPGSPNALIAVFCAIAQARFYRQGGAPPLPWYWSIDPTPRQDDGGGLPTDTPAEYREGRRIEIASSTQEAPDARSNYPAILVERGPIQYQTLNVRRTVEEVHPFRAQMLSCHAVTSITYQCLSRDDGESGGLADLIASYLYASTDELCAEFGLHHIGDPVIGPATIHKRLGNEVHAWRTDVQVPVALRYKWIKYPLAPILREFRMRLDNGVELRDLRDILLTTPPDYP